MALNVGHHGSLPVRAWQAAVQRNAQGQWAPADASRSICTNQHTDVNAETPGALEIATVGMHYGTEGHRFLCHAQAEPRGLRARAIAS